MLPVIMHHDASFLFYRLLFKHNLALSFWLFFTIKSYDIVIQEV